jgi:TM2 domain-containing membrane protein YozV
VADAKSPGLAALLSLILAGVGQFYVGAWVRGALYLVAESGLTVYFYLGLTATNLITGNIDYRMLVLLGLVSIVSMVDAALSAKSYNKKHFVQCPRCRTNNDRGLPQCLVCWAPLPAAAAPPVAGPVPPPR